MTAEIEAGFGAAVAAGNGGPPGAGFDVQAGLQLVLGRIADYMEWSRAREMHLYQQIFTRPLAPKTVTVSGSAFTITSTEHDLGPPDGFAWAVQRLTVAGLVSTGSPAVADVAAFYRGVPSAKTVDNSLLLNTVNANAPAWHPGRTGLVLQPGESLVAAGVGTVNATQVTLSGEVIQMEQWLLPHFLL